MEVKPKVEYAVDTYLPEITAIAGILYILLGVTISETPEAILYFIGGAIIIISIWARYEVGYNK